MTLQLMSHLPHLDDLMTLQLMNHLPHLDESVRLKFTDSLQWIQWALLVDNKFICSPTIEGIYFHPKKFYFERILKQF